MTVPVPVSFVIDSLGRAGTESQLVALINALDRSRVAPTLVLLDGTTPESRELEPPRVRVIRLGVTRLVSVAALRAAVKLWRHWRTERPAVVQLYFLDSTYFAAPVARLAGVRAVLRVRNNLGYWLTRRHRLLNRVVNRLVTGHLTNSDLGAASLVAQDGLRESQVTVLENGVDAERFAGGRVPLSTQELVLGVVANLRPVKNIDGLLRAVKLVPAGHPQARLEVAGDGPERANLEALASDLGIADRVKFYGTVADVPAFLRGVDVCVLPSHSEGLSNAILESLAAGRVVVATDVGANARLLGDFGYLVPPGDDEQLADAINAAIADPARSQRDATRGREFVRTHYSRKAMAERFMRHYEQLASRSKLRQRAGGVSPPCLVCATSKH